MEAVSDEDQRELKRVAPWALQDTIDRPNRRLETRDRDVSEFFKSGTRDSTRSLDAATASPVARISHSSSTTGLYNFVKTTRVLREGEKRPFFFERGLQETESAFSQSQRGENSLALFPKGRETRPDHAHTHTQLAKTSLCSRARPGTISKPPGRPELCFRHEKASFPRLRRARNFRRARSCSSSTAAAGGRRGELLGRMPSQRERLTINAAGEETRRFFLPSFFFPKRI